MLRIIKLAMQSKSNLTSTLKQNDAMRPSSGKEAAEY